MSRFDSETKPKPGEAGVTLLVDALEIQEDTLTLTPGMVFEDRVKLVVDDAHTACTRSRVEGVIRGAVLRCRNADLRWVDLLEQRGLDWGVMAHLGTCQFLTRQENVVSQRLTGSEKSSRIGADEASPPAP